MRKYWSMRAGIRYPTTISIPIPTEAELYLIMAIIILVVMGVVIDG